MGNLWRGWDSMNQTEHIVAMSLVAGTAIGIVNSSVWAAVVCYITYQRARVRLAKLDTQAYERLPTDQNDQSVGIEMAHEGI